jgi:hypothetical protein
VDDAIGGYDVRAAIVDAVSSSIAANTVRQVVENAVKSLDKTVVVQAIALEMQRCIVAGVSKVVEDAMVEIIAKLRGAYTNEEKQNIRAELRLAKEKQQ